MGGWRIRIFFHFECFSELRLFGINLESGLSVSLLAYRSQLGVYF